MSGYALFLKTNMAAFGPGDSIQNAKKISLYIGSLSFLQGLDAKRAEGDQNHIEVRWTRK